MKFILVCMAFSQFAFAVDYPKHWWKPVDKSSAPSWEILPQEAKAGEVILSKRNELGILSNFASTPFVLDGVTYLSLEGFWQMMKYPEGVDDPRNNPVLDWPFSRQDVAKMTGFDAKRAGDLGSENMAKLKINWVSYKGRSLIYKEPRMGMHYTIIERAMRAKVSQNPKVRKILLSTGSLILRPDHDQGKNPPPAWQYHRIWMKIRAELKARPHQKQ